MWSYFEGGLEAVSPCESEQRTESGALAQEYSLGQISGSYNNCKEFGFDAWLLLKGFEFRVDIVWLDVFKELLWAEAVRTEVQDSREGKGEVRSMT